MSKPAARIFVSLVSGAIAFALILPLAVSARSTISADALVLALAGAGIVSGFAAWRAPSLRTAWGRGCLVNGLLSAVVGTSLRAQAQPWPDGSPYDFDRAIGPLTHFIWALAARAGLATLILAAVLLALSWWLLGPPHRRA